MQVVSLTEIVHARIRIQVDDRTRADRLSATPHNRSQPVRARRDDRFQSLRGAQKAVGERAAQLARVAREREAERLFGFIIEHAEERAEGVLAPLRRSPPTRFKMSSVLLPSAVLGKLSTASTRGTWL